MGVHRITKGLDIPINGEAKPTIEEGNSVNKIAVIATDFPNIKPKMLVKEGDVVKCGQALFEDRENPGVLFTSPGAGVVCAVNRGAKRVLQSIVIDLQESGSDADFHNFESYQNLDKSAPTKEQVSALLQESGLWTAIKVRPFGLVANASTTPGALFLTCTDTEPLAPSVEKILEGNEELFTLGVKALSTLCTKTFLCVGGNSKIKSLSLPNVKVEEFTGKHPAGLAGTHIHMLYGTSRKRSAWHIHLQDIIAVGYLVKNGQLQTSRVISLAGPQVTSPSLIKTRLGASTKQLVAGKLKNGENRVISGSVLSGRICADDIDGYLGRYHRQITVLLEGREREFLGWLSPGGNKFSSIPIFLSALFGGKKFDFTTSTNGEHREMVPIGMYERVMPLDIIPTFLLRALEIDDLERAEQLGALELEEEDVGLCSFVCPGKQDYSIHLRRVLNQIHKEG